MKSFAVKELKSSTELLNFSITEDGLRYTIKKKNSLKVTEIIILNPDLINDLIYANFNKYYKKVLKFTLNTFNDDSDSSNSNLMLALDEITRLKNILLKKYNKYLAKELKKEMLKKLEVLEKEIKNKLVDIKFINEEKLVQNNNEEKGKSR